MSALEVFASFEKVAKAAEEENSGCSLVQTRRHIALSPKYIGRLRTGVHEILDAELGRFVKRWNGVLLAYGNMKLLQSSGAIVDDSPFIYFDVELEAVIFKPSIGSILKCVVNELLSDHIGCLVHDWFNVSLLPNKEQVNGEWQPGLEPGYEVLVQVEKLRVMNGMLAIEAREPYNGFGLNQDCNLVVDTSDGLLPLTAAGMESSEKTKKKKKRKKSGSDVASVQSSSNPDEPHAVLALQAGEETSRKKKSKKRKLLETTMESSESLASNDEKTGEKTSHKKKKKKHGDIETTVESSVAAVTEDSTHKVPETTGVETSHKKKKKKKHGDIETTVESSVAVVTEDSTHKVSETTGVETSHKKKKKKKSNNDETRSELTSTPNCSNLNVEVKTETHKKKRKKHSPALCSLPAADESHSEAFTKLKKKKSKLNDLDAKSYQGLLLTNSQCELPALADETDPDRKAKKKKKKSKRDRNDNELMNNLDLESSVTEEPNRHSSKSSLTSGSKLKSSEMSHTNHKRKQSEHGVEIAGNGLSKKKKKKKKKDTN